MLKEKIEKRQSGILLYGITPPKESTPVEKVKQIVERLTERLEGTSIDGLVLYDIQDESSRNNKPRPFPFMKTLDPFAFSSTYLQHLQVPKIYYNSIGKHTTESFKGWVNQSDVSFSVLVGAPSSHESVSLSLKEAYHLNKEATNSPLLGGVTIPERHFKKGDEHIRVRQKMENGCQYFISQCVYTVDHSKNFLSDYYYTAREEGREMVPVIFTISPCGSVKTLEFMEWLGIEIPRWLKNELYYSSDILAQSVQVCKEIVDELIAFAGAKNIPIGFNIESVAIRKEEIEASIDLLKYTHHQLQKLK